MMGACTVPEVCECLCKREGSFLHTLRLLTLRFVPARFGSPSPAPQPRSGALLRCLSALCCSAPTTKIVINAFPEVLPVALYSRRLSSMNPGLLGSDPFCCCEIRHHLGQIEETSPSLHSNSVRGFIISSLTVAETRSTPISFVVLLQQAATSFGITSDGAFLSFSALAWAPWLPHCLASISSTQASLVTLTLSTSQMQSLLNLA